jgi:polyhydroxybutyrate depolymerase
LYRIEGGGHTWPGGAQYLPARIIGPVASELDATGIMLQAFQTATPE